MKAFNLEEFIEDTDTSYDGETSEEDLSDEEPMEVNTENEDTTTASNSQLSSEYHDLDDYDGEAELDEAYEGVNAGRLLHLAKTRMYLPCTESRYERVHFEKRTRKGINGHRIQNSYVFSSLVVLGKRIKKENWI